MCRHIQQLRTVKQSSFCVICLVILDMTCDMLDGTLNLTHFPLQIISFFVLSV